MATKIPKMYDQLLKTDRIRKSKISGRTLEEEAESDRGRILFSAPFRRLQSKAQVFALETNASVRSRLTHTLEVATVGRQLAQAALNEFKKRRLLGKLGLRGKERAFVSFVDAACLIHDVGNPPFGHFGEAAISNWFQQHTDLLTPKRISGNAQKLWHDHYADFINFDGNPQGLRIVTHLQCEETLDFTGLNLTATTIAACIKYPFGSSELSVDRKKAGYFETEAEIVRAVQNKLCLEKNARHPLVALMEAADDTAYCISDIEDGIEKRIVNAHDLAGFVKKEMMRRFRKHRLYAKMIPELLQLLAQLHKSDPIESKRKRKLSPLSDIRSLVLRYVSEYVGEQYCNRHTKIMRGDCTPLLPDDGPDALMEVFREFAKSKLYFSRLVRQREISAHATFTGLLDAYKPVMLDEEARFKKAMTGDKAPDGSSKITIEASLLSQIGEKHKVAYFEALRNMGHKSPKEREILERVYRIRMIVDFISGMTDDFAYRTFQLASGASDGGGWI